MPRKTLHKVIFANDTNLFLSHKNVTELQELFNIELQNVDHWFKANKLSLNISKTNYIIFCPKKTTTQDRGPSFPDQNEWRGAKEREDDSLWFS